MSYAGDITLPFADGEHRFRLRIGQLRELQEKCKAGPPTILQRLASQAWMIEDVAETLRLGLIGGDMPPTAALKLIQTYVYEGGWFENVIIAHQVLTAAIIGPEDDDDLGEPRAGEAEMNSPTAGSPSPTSTRTPAPADTTSTRSSEWDCGSSGPSSPGGEPPTAVKKSSARRRTTSTTT